MKLTSDAAGTPLVRPRLVALAGFAVAVVAINSFCTQWAAGRLSHHPALGKPILGSLYDPFAWWRWMFRYYATAKDTWGYCFIIFALASLVALLIAALYIGFVTRSLRRHDDIHGSAAFATFKEAQESGLLPADGKAGEGVYCGSVEDPASGNLHYLRHNGPEHICAIAPTRSGKGVGLVIPTLLTWPESCFILDRKAENWNATAGWRASPEGGGNRVFRFDPANPKESCAWNALAEIRFETRFQVSDAQNIALMVMDSDGRGIEHDHWRSAAYELLTGIILHALYRGKVEGWTPGLHTCAMLLTDTDPHASDATAEVEDGHAGSPDGEAEPLRALLAEMEAVEIESAGSDEAQKAAREAQLLIRSVGHRMAQTPKRELGSIVSTANNALALYRDPIVAENTSRSDFRIADLMDAEQPVSVYFVTTPRNADRMKPLARLLLSQIVLGLADEMKYNAGGRSVMPHRHRLLLMLDEFPTLGKLEVFESALAYIAGYGMKAYLITQDVQQLYKAYSNYESIISNCHIRVAYAPNKVETAEWLSRMAGQKTVVAEQVTTSGKRFGAVLEQVSHSYHEVQRPLMTPDEVMRLPGPKKDKDGDILEPGDMLVFVAGRRPILGKQVLYFQNVEMARRSQMPPPESTTSREVECDKQEAFAIQ